MTAGLPVDPLERTRLLPRLAEADDVATAAALAVTTASTLTGASAAVLVQLHPRTGPQVLASTDPDVAGQMRLSAGDSDVAEVLIGTHAEPALVRTDLGDDPRWPAYTSRLLANTAVRSCVVQRISFADRYVGALVLFHHRPGFFAPSMQRLLRLTAEQAVIGVAVAALREENRQLQEALTSSRQIGTALGILMATHKITESTAFARLTRVSQVTQRKLREIAGDVVNTGDLLDPEPAPRTTRRPRRRRGRRRASTQGPAHPNQLRTTRPLGSPTPSTLAAMTRPS